MTKYSDDPKYRKRVPLIVLGIFSPWASQFAKAHANKFLGQVADSWAAQQMAEKPIVSLWRSLQ